MKLEMTIPSTPGFLHMLPGLDIIALVLIYPLLGASLVQQTGVDVTLNELSWRYEHVDNPILITLEAGDDSPLWVNKKLVPSDQLEKEIQQLRSEEGGSSINTVLLRTDVEVATGVEREVINRVLKLGLDCKLLGSSAEGN